MYILINSYFVHVFTISTHVPVSW